MKSVLISIQPKWCEHIASGRKTIEVRKTRPKIETPFKCYIYCTYGNKKENYMLGKRGKVIGEFVCERIVGNFKYLVTPKGLECACLTEQEVNDYLGLKGGYGWHISDLKIYDKPKELSEFWGQTKCSIARTRECWVCFAPCKEIDGKIYQPMKKAPQSWGYCEELEK